MEPQDARIEGVQVGGVLGGACPTNALATAAYAAPSAVCATRTGESNGPDEEDDDDEVLSARWFTASPMLVPRTSVRRPSWPLAGRVLSTTSTPRYLTGGAVHPKKATTSAAPSTKFDEVPLASPHAGKGPKFQ